MNETAAEVNKKYSKLRKLCDDKKKEPEVPSVFELRGFIFK